MNKIDALIIAITISLIMTILFLLIKDNNENKVIVIQKVHHTSWLQWILGTLISITMTAIGISNPQLISSLVNNGKQQITRLYQKIATPPKPVKPRQKMLPNTPESIIWSDGNNKITRKQ